MKRNIFALLRTFVLAAFVPALSLSLVSCEPENESDNEDNTDNLESSETSDYEAVDLGLSVKWASCNVGAQVPEEYGDFYAWGEIVSKNNYSESTYLYYDNGAYEYIGADICGTEYDVAHLVMGDNWRMPTQAEVEELYHNCTWEWTEVNGVSGEKITGPNGNSIFLPAAGYRESDRHNSKEAFGYYSSGTLSSNDEERAFCFAFRNGARLTSFTSRYGGQTIRPVWGNVSILPHHMIKVFSPQCNISYKATIIDVELKANIDVKLKIQDASSWIRQQTVTRTLVTHNFVFEIDENEAREPREARIVFYNSEYAVADTLTLVQEGNPDALPYRAVDLGLSVAWASCNVGADSPEDYGDYFAWGETASKSYYSLGNTVTYGLSISELESRGIIGSDGNLRASYDAATVNWGSDWRMPTLDEINELRGRCTWGWITQNGVNGYKVTGPNGNSIFLPVAGHRYGSEVYERDSCGYYWYATPYSSSYDAYSLLFDSSGRRGWGNRNRGYGHTVRPVSELSSDLVSRIR